MILVAGATGTTGSIVVRELVARGAPVRALTRDPAKAAALEAARAEPAVADLADPHTLIRPLRGVERLYVALPASPRLPELEANLFAVAEQSGAYAAVKLGAAAAPGSRLAEVHAASAATLQASSLRWTILQPTGFLQGFLGHPRVVSARADARAAYVDAGDVAAVAARALGEEDHDGCTYRLTGPEALTDAQVAGVLGAEHVAVDDEQMAGHRRALGLPDWDVDALAELDAFVRDGGAAEATGDVVALLGRPATSLRQLAGAAG